MSPSDPTDAAGLAKEIERLANQYFAGVPGPALNMTAPAAATPAVGAPGPLAPPNVGPNAMNVGAGAGSPSVGLPPIPGAMHRPPIAAAPPPKESDLRAIPTLLSENLGTPSAIALASAPSADAQAPYFLEIAGLPSTGNVPAPTSPGAVPEWPEAFTIPLTSQDAAVAPSPSPAPQAAAPAVAVPQAPSYGFQPEVVPDPSLHDRRVRSERREARFSDPPGARARPAARLARQRGHDAEAASSHRSPLVLLRARELERAPRRPHARCASDGRVRSRAREGEPFPQGAFVERDRLRARHDRSDQPRRAELGPSQRRPGRRDRDHLARAPREHRPVAAARIGEGGAPPGRAGRRPRTGHPRGVRAPARAPNADRVIRPGLQRPRDDHAGARDGRDGASPRGARSRRRRAGSLAHAGRCAGARLRLLLLLRSQGVRPDGYRSPLRQNGRARDDAPVAGRRKHDRRRHVREDGLPAAPRSVRGGDREHRRRCRPRGRNRLPERPRPREREPLRARAPRLRDRAACARARAHHDRHRTREGGCLVLRGGRDSAQRMSAARSTRRGSRSARVITAPSQFSGASGSRARFARRSRSTTPARTSTRWWRRSSACSRDDTFTGFDALG